MKFILGRNIGMTQRFEPDGTVVPVTVLAVPPCVVSAIKTKEQDGYTAVQVAGLPTKPSRVAKSVQGQLKDLGSFKVIKEFRVEKIDAEVKRGTPMDVSRFAPGDKVAVTGTSKGKGFAGVVKRHHFRGGPASHGHKDNLRMPGSIGATFPQHVVKGRRMAGRMGGERVTIKYLKVVEVSPDKNLMLVSGAVPGSTNGLVSVRGE